MCNSYELFVGLASEFEIDALYLKNDYLQYDSAAKALISFLDIEDPEEYDFTSALMTPLDFDNRKLFSSGSDYKMNK